jgi:hypothetical protein
VADRPADFCARNARLHSEAQVDQIAGSIREFGFAMPVLVDEQGTLIVGHGRVQAAQKLGLADVPTMVARGWSEAQIKAYRILDNRLPMSAAWDEGMLRIELGDLKRFAPPARPMSPPAVNGSRPLRPPRRCGARRGTESESISTFIAASARAREPLE